MKKKIFAGVIIASMMLGTIHSYAQELGVVALNPEEKETVSYATLDDLQIGDVVEIDGFGELTAVSFEFTDDFVYKYDWEDSEDEADYAIVRIKMLNTNTSAKRYLNDFEVKAIYDDKYEYQGWAFQCKDKDGSKYHAIDYSEDTGDIKPLYEGYYMFGCTLPNAVVSGSAPLRMEIKFDGNEITYNVRE